MFANRLTEFLDFHALHRPDQLMMQDANGRCSYRQGHQRSLAFAAQMQADGLKKGDRAAIIAKNSADNLLLFLACAYAGVVPVGLNYRLNAKEVAFIAEDAEAKCVFFDSEFEPLLEGTLGRIPGICLDKADAHTHVNDWLQCSADQFEPVEIGLEDTLFQMYTSGTTGLPKGALLSHSNIINCGFQASITAGLAISPGDRALVIAPTFHAAGLSGALVGIINGASLIIHSDFDPVGMIDTLEKEQIAATTVIPIMLQFSLMMVEDIRDRDFSHLKVITYGANPIDPNLLRDCMDIFGCQFSQGYGQTESTAVLTTLTPLDHERAMAGDEYLLQSCGRAVFGTDLKIVDIDGKERPRGEAGEIIARGPQVMQGYWKRADATADTIVDGWLHTGDAGYMDEEGYVFIKDRIKDLIISGGENIYPAEIEKRLTEHPSVQDASVIGRKDAQWGEVPIAVLVLAPGEDELSLADVQSFCAETIAKFKLPKQIQYVSELPRNPTGKVLKKVLREQYGQA